MNNLQCLFVKENYVQLQTIDIFGFFSKMSRLQRPPSQFVFVGICFSTDFFMSYYGGKMLC